MLRNSGNKAIRSCTTTSSGDASSHKTRWLGASKIQQCAFERQEVMAKSGLSNDVNLCLIEIVDQVNPKNYMHGLE